MFWTPARWYDEARAQASATAEDLRKKANHAFELYLRVLAKPADEIAELLQEFNSSRLETVPDLKEYPELRDMPALLEARWRGWRDGADLDAGPWAALCDGLYYYHRRIQRSPLPEQGCTAIFLPDSDRGPVLGKNLDIGLTHPFGRPDWPAVSEHLIWEGVSCGIFCDEQPPEIFPAPVWDLVSRYCQDTSQALDMLDRYRVFWGPGNGVVVDREGNSAVVEKSACRIGVRPSDDGFSAVTSMTMQEPDMRAFLFDRRAASLQARGLEENHPDTVFWAAADRKGELLNELLEELRAEPTVEKLRQVLQFRDPQRGRIACNGERLGPEGPELAHTARTTLWLLAEGKAMWWAREEDRPSWENRMPDLAYEDVPLWR